MIRARMSTDFIWATAALYANACLVFCMRLLPGSDNPAHLVNCFATRRTALPQ